MKAKISIVVPVYNVEEYLKACLDSLVKQSFENIRIICVDDGSTDGSQKVLDDYMKRDSRIEVIKKKNGGLSSARNAGLKKVDTKYVMFCDSDDTFDVKMCEKMFTAVEKNGSDVAVCENNMIYLAHDEMRQSDFEYYKLKYSGTRRITDDIILNTNVSANNKIFRMDIIGDKGILFPDGLNNEDFYFYNAYMSVASKITFVDDKLYNYLRRENSIMSTNFEAEALSIDHLKVAEKLYGFYKKNDVLRQRVNLFWRQWVMSYWFCVEHSSKDQSEAVKEVAVGFVDRKFKEMPPTDIALKKEILDIVEATGGFKQKIKGGLVRVYKCVKPSYRKQLRLNISLERALSGYQLIDTRLDEILRGEKRNEK